MKKCSMQIPLALRTMTNDEIVQLQETKLLNQNEI